MVAYEVHWGAAVLTYSPLPVCASIIKCFECAEGNHRVAPVEERHTIGSIRKQSVSRVLDIALYHAMLSVGVETKRAGADVL